MVDLETLFAPPQLPFYSTLLRVYGEARRNFALGIAGEPTHWLFNIPALDMARYDFDVQSRLISESTNLAMRDPYEVKLMGLPIKIESSDLSDLPRFEIITRPWPGSAR